MKKILISIFLTFALFYFSGCNNGKYELIVNDNFNLIINSLSKYYEPGEIVEVKTPFYSGMEPGINVDGEKISKADSKVCEYTLFRFKMPDHDSVLYTTMNGFRCNSCGEGKHQYDNERIEDNNGFVTKVYTCSICWHQKREKENKEGYYSLKVSGKINYLVNNVNGVYAENTKVTIKTIVPSNCYLEVYVNGEKAEFIDENIKDRNYIFEFIMPSQDSVVEIRESNFIHLKDIKEYNWINNLIKENIVEVRYESAPIGVAPGMLTTIKYSSDLDDIDAVYNFLNNALFRPTALYNKYISGGGYSKYDVILNDGKTYSIYIGNNNIYNQDESVYTLVSEMNKLENISLECHSFILYITKYNIYNKENELIGEFSDLDNVEFIIWKEEIPEVEPEFYIESQMSKLYIISPEYICIMADNDIVSTYKIIGDRNFSFLFED